MQEAKTLIDAGLCKGRLARRGRPVGIQTARLIKWNTVANCREIIIALGNGQ